MKRLLILGVSLLTAILMFGQEIQVTFTGTGETEFVDSVTAVNMSTGEELTLPGNEILYLTSTSSIINIIDQEADLHLYPNPFGNRSKVTISQRVAELVQISIQDLSGRMLFINDQYLDCGKHTFDLVLNSPGIFLISLKSQTRNRNIKAICTLNGNRGVGLFYSSSSTRTQKLNDNKLLKSGNSTYSMSYSLDDYLHFTCKSGKYKTIITDSPKESRNYEIEFADCTDTNGKTYKVIKLGDQIWMAENLAFLPDVSPAENVSVSESLHYVYGYSGSNVSEAKETEDYLQYGALYNHVGALEACHDGWHLPSEDEWKILTTYLERNGFGFVTSSVTYDHMIAKSMASRVGWDTSFDGGKVGAQPEKNNKSGFCIMPAGYLYNEEFAHQGAWTSFWTSISLASNRAVSQSLASDMRTLGRGTPDEKNGLSVRCLKSE